MTKEITQAFNAIDDSLWDRAWEIAEGMDLEELAEMTEYMYIGDDDFDLMLESAAIQIYEDLVEQSREPNHD